MAPGPGISRGVLFTQLKTAWHDGTRELVFEAQEFLERLAAITPWPETSLFVCHGVLALARWRRRVVAYGRTVLDPANVLGSAAALAPAPDGVGEQPKQRAWSWAALMHRAFAIDVLACRHVHPVGAVCG